MIDSLIKDANGISVQIGSSIKTTDDSVVVKESPFTLTGGVDAISVPENAVEFIVNPAASLKVSEDATMSTYDVVAANTKESIPCSRMDIIYVEGSGTLNFRFTIV